MAYLKYLIAMIFLIFSSPVHAATEENFRELKPYDVKPFRFIQVKWFEDKMLEIETLPGQDPTVEDLKGFVGRNFRSATLDIIKECGLSFTLEFSKEDFLRGISSKRDYIPNEKKISELGDGLLYAEAKTLAVRPPAPK
jgi:hypothetical protein